jgi:hypothetical protein
MEHQTKTVSPVPNHYYDSDTKPFFNYKNNLTSPGVVQKRDAPFFNKESQPTNASQIHDKAAERNSMSDMAVAKTENATGMPDNLKSGIENLSGYSVNDVKVHYNSDNPAQLQALAYAQGTDIHLAPGHEKHLPHEAWHVVQQKQGRVKPTLQMKGKVNINDDDGLEEEADVMGAKAIQLHSKAASPNSQLVQPNSSAWIGAMQLKKGELVKNRLNVVGENHRESDGRRQEEKDLSSREAGGEYWGENQFRIQSPKFLDSTADANAIAFADPLYLRIAQNVQLLNTFNMFKTILRLWSSEGENGRPNLKKAATKNIFNSKNHIDDILEHIKATVANRERVAYTDEKISLLNNIEYICSETVRPQFLQIMNIFEKIKVEESVPTDLIEAEIKYTLGLDDMMKIAKDLGGHDSDTTSRMRSHSMNVTANDRYKTKGVWKIGDAHYKDMKDMKKEYNLIGREEFNEKYKNDLVTK